MSSFMRVIPRDLFNEAALLKCLGKIALMAHNGIVEKLKMVYEPYDNGNGEECEGFLILQDDGSGDLYCNNVAAINADGDNCLVFRKYNDKSQWSVLIYPSDTDSILVMDDEGNPTKEFIEWARGS